MQNAPTRKGQGVERHLTDTHAHTISATRMQFLRRYGISYSRAILVGDLALGEVRP